MTGLVRSGKICFFEKNPKPPSGEVQSSNTAVLTTKSENSIANIIRVTDDESFESILKSTLYKSVVIEFVDTFSEKRMTTSPFVAEQAKKNDVLFLIVDQNMCPKTAFSYEIVYVPQIVFRKNNYVIDRLDGAKRKSFKSFFKQNYRDPKTFKTPPLKLLPNIRFPDQPVNFMEWLNFDDKPSTRPNAYALVVVYFYADWCSSHDTVFKSVHKQAKAYIDVMFLVVNVDKCQKIAIEYHVSVLPTFVFLRKYDLVCMFKGADEDELKRRLDKHNTLLVAYNRNPVISVHRKSKLEEKLVEAENRPVLICFCNQCIVPNMPKKS